MSRLKIERILVPTDFSAQAEKAYRYALGLAEVFRSEIVLLHVFDTRVVEDIYHIHRLAPETARAEMQRVAKEKVDALCALDEAQDLRISARYDEGIPPVKVREVAEEIGADLIVMGTHGQSGLTQLLYGSTAEGVVHCAPCPVLTTC